MVGVYFLPLAEQYEGWLAIEISMVSFGGGTRNIKISALSENAIARVMQGMRDCSPLDSLKGELLEWTLSSVMNCMANQNRPDILCIPTKSRVFTAKWDRNHCTYVYTNWQPERLLADKEQAIVDKLRREERLGLDANLGDCA